MTKRAVWRRVLKDLIVGPFRHGPSIPVRPGMMLLHPRNYAADVTEAHRIRTKDEPALDAASAGRWAVSNLARL